MLPAKERLVTCPHCGQKKALLELASGNTIDAIHYSDARTVAPMMPRVLPVQRCPECGKYYLTWNQPYEEGEDYSFERGELFFAEMIEAYEQLKDQLTNDQERHNFHIYVLWAFNDTFFRPTEDESDDVEKPAPTEADYAALQPHIEALLEMHKDDNSGQMPMLRAEWHREIGQFEQCIALLENFIVANESEEDIEGVDNGFLKHVASQILEHARAKDPKVFAIVPPERSGC